MLRFDLIIVSVTLGQKHWEKPTKIPWLFVAGCLPSHREEHRSVLLWGTKHSGSASCSSRLSSNLITCQAPIFSSINDEVEPDGSKRTFGPWGLLTNCWGSYQWIYSLCLFTIVGGSRGDENICANTGSFLDQGTMPPKEPHGHCFLWLPEDSDSN